MHTYLFKTSKNINIIYKIYKIIYFIYKIYRKIKIFDPKDKCHYLYWSLGNLFSDRLFFDENNWSQFFGEGNRS